MILLIIFVILLAATVFAWFNQRKIAFTLFIITLLISIVNFIQDMTTRLNLQL